MADTILSKTSDSLNQVEDDSDAEDNFLCGALFTSDVAVETCTIDMGEGTSHPVSVQVECVHRENQFIEKFVAQVVWPSSAALCNQLLRNSDEYFPQSATVIELGSGTGVCGIGLAKAKVVAKCVLTDYKQEAIDLLEKSTSQNGVSESCPCKLLTWGNMNECKDMIETVNGGEPFSVCVGTDVVYEPESVLPLFQSANALLGEGGKFILANHTSRYAGLELVVKREAVVAGFTETVMESIMCEDGKVDWSVFTKVVAAAAAGDQ